MKKSAFTLIELLVVIAIIAILAALAIPGLQSSIEKARSLTDANQMKSLGTMFLRYLNEHEDQMPSLAGGGDTWPALIHKQTPDYKVFLSPFDKRPVTNSDSSPVSYGVNQNAYGLNASDFNTPSQLIMMAPLASGNPTSTPIFTGNASTNVAVPPGGSRGIARKGTQLNVLFADWHVTPMTHDPDFKDTSSVKGKQHWEPKYVQGED